MSALTDRVNRMTELRKEIEAQAGRKGVTALRNELAQLETANKAVDERRAQMRRNMQGQVREVRGKYWAEEMRRKLQLAERTTVSRGGYGEIMLDAPHDAWYTTDAVARLPERTHGHPALAHLRPYWTAWQMIEKAQTAGLLPKSWAEFDHKGRGTAVNLDLYGYNLDGSLVLVQVRRTEITKYRNTTIRYFVTDGETAVEITNGKKALIKKAATADPRPDSTLRIVRPVLPEAWQAQIADEPIKLLSYQARPWPAWKVLRQYADGRLLSLYDDTTWTLGTPRSEKAQEHHGGGYYVRTGAADSVRAQFDAGNLAYVPDGRNVDWQAALVRCECRGRTVEYDSGKMAVSMCRPVEIVTVW